MKWLQNVRCCWSVFRWYIAIRWHYNGRVEFREWSGHNPCTRTEPFHEYWRLNTQEGQRENKRKEAYRQEPVYKHLEEKGISYQPSPSKRCYKQHNTWTNKQINKTPPLPRPSSCFHFRLLPLPRFPLSSPCLASPSLPSPSFPFPSLPFPSLPCPSLPLPPLPSPPLPSPSLPFPSLPFPSLPFPSLPFPSLPFPSLPSPSLPFPRLASPPVRDILPSFSGRRARRAPWPGRHWRGSSPGRTSPGDLRQSGSDHTLPLCCST